MKIIEQVCQFDQAVALRALKIAQDKSTYYLYNTGSDVIITHTFVQPYEDNSNSPWVAVFTVSELGHLLPAGTTVFKTIEGWKAEYKANGAIHASSFHRNEAPARAALLIELLNKNILTIENVNRRLAE